MESSGRSGEWVSEGDMRRQDPFAEDDDEDFLANASSAHYQPRPPTAPPEPLGDFLSPTPLTPTETIQLGRDAIRGFLSSRTVYDAMPKSGRVVIFDANINLKLVMYALLEHDIRGAPLWSALFQTIVGVVSLSDFTDILRHCEMTGDNLMAILDHHTITTWRTLLPKATLTASSEEIGARCAASLFREYQAKGKADRQLISVAPYSTLLDACTLLKNEKIHRLPVVDPALQTCLQVISYQGILEYLTTQFAEERRLFDQSIYNMGVGSFMEPETSKYMQMEARPEKKLLVADLNTTLREVGEIFGNSDVSTIPIFEVGSRKVRDLYRRAYIASINLEQPDLPMLKMQQVLDQLESTHPELLEPLQTCTPFTTLYQVFVQFAETKSRTLVVLDDKGMFLGLCSLTDVLGHFI